MIPTRRLVILIWILAALGAAAFLAMAAAVGAGVTKGFDSAVLLGLRDASDLSNPWGPPWFENTMVELSALGGYPILVPVALVSVAVLFLLGHRAAALFLLLALGSGTALSTGLKLFFDRARPDLVMHLDKISTASFPSGHATVGMLAWMVLAVVAVRFVPLHRVRVFLLAAAFALAIVIGASRVYLGVHWPSDVLAGWCLGLSWACLCWLAAHHLGSRRKGPDLGRSET
ncbi:MAG: phosphatase PAP2 family protein [Flavobacteriaceae bacterium]